MSNSLLTDGQKRSFRAGGFTMLIFFVFVIYLIVGAYNGKEIQTEKEKEKPPVPKSLASATEENEFYIKNMDEYKDANDVFKIDAVIPKESDHFTQGLFFYGDTLYETCGRYGHSAIYKDINLNKESSDDEDEFYADKYTFNSSIFAEGATMYANRDLICLSYKENKMFEFDPETLELTETHEYPYEGWGICSHADLVYTSDGSNIIHVMGALTKETNRINVKSRRGIDVDKINELEYVDGKIYANIFTTNYIVVIDPETGFIENLYDFSTLIDEKYDDPDSVLNGIAYHPDGYFIITGKNYENYYKISFK